MKAFMDKEFMLQSPTAQHLYHDYAADMPICDYHCHIPPREIYENRRFENIAPVLWARLWAIPKSAFEKAIPARH